MFKLCVFAALFAYATAGLIPIDDAYGYGGNIAYGSYGGYGGYGGLGSYGYGGIALAAPKVAYAAPATIAVKAGATSYQNSNLLSLNPTAVVTKAVAAPIVTKVAAPFTYAAPIAKVAAPISYAAPAVSVVSLGHYGLGELGYGGYAH